MADSLSSRKVAGVARATRAVGADVLCLPPNSPDFNPIERTLSRSEAESRKRGPRTRADGDALGGACLDRFPPEQCRNYIRHAGYIPQESDQKIL